MRPLVDTTGLPQLNVNYDTMGTAKNWLHGIQTVTTLLAVCMVIPVIATEIRFYGGSQPGPNFTLFVAIFTAIAPGLLFYFPWRYEKTGNFRAWGKFFLKPRTNVIFSGSSFILWAAAGIACTVHSNNPAHCTIDPKLQKAYGDDYLSSWSVQCNLAKAAAAFSWFTCLAWLGTLIIASIVSYNEKQEVQLDKKKQQQTRLEHDEGKHSYDDDESVQHNHHFADEEAYPEGQPLHTEQYYVSPEMAHTQQGPHQHWPHDHAQQATPPVQYDSQPTYYPMPEPTRPY